MYNNPFVHSPLSSNIYVRRTQLIKRIADIKAIFQNQKFSNEILYSFKDLHEVLAKTKTQLKETENDIKKLENNVWTFSL